MADNKEIKDPRQFSNAEMYELYMGSSALTWKEFMDIMGWSKTGTRLYDIFPTTIWVREKKQIFAKRQAEELAGLTFDHSSRWHKDVFKTLKEYPETIDAAMALLRHRMNQFIQMMAAGQVVDTAELVKISMTVKMLTEAKYKALLLDKWNVNMVPKDSGDIDRETDNPMSFKLIGGEEMSIQKMQELMAKYIDKPAEEADEQDNG